MRWIFLPFIMLVAIQALALTITEPPLKDRICAMLQPVDPAKPETSAQVEENLVALEKDALPDMRDVFTEFHASRQTAEQEERWEHARLWETRATVLDRAIVRLETGFDWPRLIRMWIEQQYRPNQQAIPESLPEPVRITDSQVQRAFPDYLFYISSYPRGNAVNRIQPPLSANNVFAVKKDMGPGIAGQLPPTSQIALLTDPDLLKAFFLAVPKPLLIPGEKTDYDRLQAGMKDLAYAWLRLSEEIHNDGFLRFTISEKSLQFAVSASDAGGYMARGRAEVVQAGGNAGAITADLIFNNVGLLIDVKENVTIQSGLLNID